MIRIPPLDSCVINFHRPFPDVRIKLSDIVVEIAPIKLPDKRLTFFLHFSLRSVVQFSDADATKLVVGTELRSVLYWNIPHVFVVFELVKVL